MSLVADCMARAAPRRRMDRATVCQDLSQDMTLYALKPAFQSWLRPMVVRLAAAGVTAMK